MMSRAVLCLLVLGRLLPGASARPDARLARAAPAPAPGGTFQWSPSGRRTGSLYCRVGIGFHLQLHPDGKVNGSHEASLLSELPPLPARGGREAGGWGGGREVPGAGTGGQVGLGQRGCLPPGPTLLAPGDGAKGIKSPASGVSCIRCLQIKLLIRFVLGFI